MVKVIKIDKETVRCKKHNNLYAINSDLARAKNMIAMMYFPKRKEFMEYIIKKHKNMYPDSPYKVSKKDIKRLENPRKYEIPVNIVEILEILVEEVITNKDKVTYRASDDEILSKHMIFCTIKSLNNFAAWLAAHPIGERPMNDKYRQEVSYVINALERFDLEYNFDFNSLF